ncbi:MAG: GYD domain-containing protein [Syntrophaceae bacterium]|nr:GYD domain-containing protein [Syntrophaceae bacterium]
MATFLMLGKYSAEAVKKISAKRTRDAASLIKKHGGKVEAMYALLGEKDLVFILDFPGVAQAMKASVALSKMTGIGFSTHPAVRVEEFDKLMAK